MDSSVSKYHIRGTRRRLYGVASPPEKFDTVIIASGHDDAQRVARDNWRDEWYDVEFTHTVSIP